MKKNIILRDLPKEQVQIDIWPFAIHGGFRGFQKVPSGLHYISVLHHNVYPGFWCFIENNTIVKVFNSETSEFIDADKETTVTFQKMADNGVMNDKLIAYPEMAILQWYQLTSYINPQNFKELIDLNTVNFSDEESDPFLLAAFQMSFLKVIVKRPEFVKNEDVNLWKEWLEKLYHTDTETIKNHLELFLGFVDLFILQHKIIPLEYKNEISVIMKDTKQFVQKLEQLQDPKLSVKASQLKFSIY